MTSKCSDCMICPNREDTFQNYHLILNRCSWLAGLDCDDSEIFKKNRFQINCVKYYTHMARRRGKEDLFIILSFTVVCAEWSIWIASQLVLYFFLCLWCEFFWSESVSLDENDVEERERFSDFLVFFFLWRCLCFFLRFLLDEPMSESYSFFESMVNTFTPIFTTKGISDLPL